MNTIITLLYFILALFILVTIHEYGHFLVARICGVKVLRFSFGFGKVLACWHDKRGTEYVWSIAPFGGYVKMLDESEGEVPDTQKHLSFNNKSVWARIAIVLAGPLFNFIFAFFALWLVLMIGIKSLAPIVEGVEPGSLVEKAGLKPNQEIVMFDEKTISSWRDFQYEFMLRIGSDKPIEITTKSISTGNYDKIFLPLAGWQPSERNPNFLENIGIKPLIPKFPTIVGQVLADSPASRAGVLVDDKVILLNDKPIIDWLYLVDFAKDNPGKNAMLTIERDGKLKQIEINIGQKEADGVVIGYVGLVSKPIEWPKDLLRVHREGAIKAIGTAFGQTIELTNATFALIGKLITGKLSVRNISGPVGIARGAGDSGRSGFAYYLSFLAIVSISLGVLNLLPIPILDGGHLLFYFIEIIRRQPLSNEVRSMGMYVGFVLLISLMVVALGNDLSRLLHT